jgi:benzoylsuccinyl-CoA thiolase BbsB subunit
MSLGLHARDVSISGTGMVRFARRLDMTVPQLGAQAADEAIRESGLDRSQITSIYCGTVFGGPLTAQKIGRELALTGVEALNVENACSSSAAAFRLACLAVAAGVHEHALVVGVEKLSHLGSGPLPLGDEDIEVSNGLNMPALYAMRAGRYMHEHGLRPEELALVAVKARRHGLLNPYAQVRAETTVEAVLASRPIASPLTVLQCCPMGDGAAALIVSASDAKNTRDMTGVKVHASHLTSGKFMADSRDMTSPEVTVRCAQETYESCGIGPEDIDVVECHDAFTIAEILYYEALGFAPQGQGIALLKAGTTSLGGRVPFNPSGGLLCRGHPPGASGAAQLVEVARQLQGRCGARQIGRDRSRPARFGLTHVTGGGIYGFDHAACCIHVLGV